MKDVITLKAAESLRVTFKTTNGGKARKPHQAFLTLTNPDSGLEEAFAIAVQENGKGKLDLVSNCIL